MAYVEGRRKTAAAIELLREVRLVSMAIHPMAILTMAMLLYLAQQLSTY